VQGGQTWEQPLNFSFSQVSLKENQSIVGGLTVNGVTVAVNKPAMWDEGNSGYFYQLFVELWIYNVTSDTFQFNNRFVSLWLNMTAAT
jgi:hypothetical protein